jgi:hypothetical protein
MGPDVACDDAPPLRRAAVGLLFGAGASTVCGHLWFKSRYIPRALAAFGVVSSAFCVACTLVFYIFPNFDDAVNLWWFDSPMGIFRYRNEFVAPFQGTAIVCGAGTE